ncbi:hypothetical protein C1H46_019685 [Malus baccata]|uniref:BZIP domain-containing protein n=1 Tax=Malus baccata TaxID=106549 RepID=A0A540M881_MALBA|nr:hypothetical protein C1H46_019685 [Malus baccata]
MVVQDDWTRAAMTDDVLVVELLLRLKQAQAAGPSSSLRSSSPMSQSLLTLRWGVRMPRSKAASSGSRFDGGVLHQRNSGKNGADSTTRCSPTTPLSWSGGTGSPSATADGFEESSCPRSKQIETFSRFRLAPFAGHLSFLFRFTKLPSQDPALDSATQGHFRQFQTYRSLKTPKIPLPGQLFSSESLLLATKVGSLVKSKWGVVGVIIRCGAGAGIGSAVSFKKPFFLHFLEIEKNPAGFAAVDLGIVLLGLPNLRGNGTYESTSTTNAAKRARRKKTYAELKEQESSLLKERTHLEKEIATLQATFKEQRAKNDNFKRIKIDLDLHSARNLSANFDGAGKAISSQPHERIASSSTTAFYIPSDLPPSPHPRLDSCVESNNVPARDNSFLLPDLNMVPAVEESASEMLYGMS